MAQTKSYACHAAGAKLEPWSFERRAVGEGDVRIDIKYCGICHSDLHHLRNEWQRGSYPMVAGHEIVGIVSEVGAGVTKFAVGDKAGIGCFINSCRTCDACAKAEEQYCPKMSLTYNSTDKGFNGTGQPTYGGYSSQYVLNERYAVKIPENLPLADAAPLLCAGITVYDPMKHFGLKPGMKLGVVGLGGLGHVAVKFGVAWGCEVTVFSTSPKKEAEARQFGASKFVVTADKAQIAAAARSLDMVLDTVSAPHDIEEIVQTIKVDGRLVLLGCPPAGNNHSFYAGSLIFPRVSISGSLIGGTANLQEMLDFAGKHNLLPMTEVVSVTQVNEALARLEKNDVKYRFVLDMKDL
eukprot:Colp12_sorted_trinity150504_noHs@21542